jgi:hypothetical protein
MATKSKADLKHILADKVSNLTVQDEVSANSENANNNLGLYNRVRSVPAEAQKPITGGRLNGFTDINPMWRIKTLTEQFGMVGFGWYYDISRAWTESGANNEVAAFVEIDLYIKQDSEWSKPIKGIGGSSFVANESKGLYTSDEAYKMALTDAISTSCKALGIAADVYFAKDRTKYDNNIGNETERNTPPDEANGNNNVPPAKGLTAKQINRLHAIRKSVNMDEDTLKKIMMKHYNKSSSEELTRPEYDFICNQLEAMQNKQKNTA